MIIEKNPRKIECTPLAQVCNSTVSAARTYTAKTNRRARPSIEQAHVLHGQIISFQVGVGGDLQYSVMFWVGICRPRLQSRTPF